MYCFPHSPASAKTGSSFAARAAGFMPKKIPTKTENTNETAHAPVLTINDWPFTDAYRNTDNNSRNAADKRNCRRFYQKLPQASASRRTRRGEGGVQRLRHLRCPKESRSERKDVPNDAAV